MFTLLIDLGPHLSCKTASGVIAEQVNTAVWVGLLHQLPEFRRLIGEAEQIPQNHATVLRAYWWKGDA